MNTPRTPIALPQSELMAMGEAFYNISSWDANCAVEVELNTSGEIEYTVKARRWSNNLILGWGPSVQAAMERFELHKLKTEADFAKKLELEYGITSPTPTDEL